LNKKRDLRKYKPERGYRLKDLYQLLERIYHEIIGEKVRGGYKSKRLSNLIRSVRGSGNLPSKLNQPFYRSFRRYPIASELKYNPKPKVERLSFSGGKPWTEPKPYSPPQRIVYDPEAKSLLRKIERHLKEGFDELNTNRNLEELDVEELTKTLEQTGDPKVLEKLLEKELIEINEAEPEPKLYELDEEEEGLEEKNTDLSEILEKSAEKGMSIDGPFEMDDAEFEQLVEELKKTWSSCR